MLLPYNVDRRTVGTPIVTYILMGLNILCFLLSVTVSNFLLAEDQRAGRAEIAALIQNDTDRTEGILKLKEKMGVSKESVAPLRFKTSQQVQSEFQVDGASEFAESEFAEEDAPESAQEQMRLINQAAALGKVVDQINTRDGYRRYYQISKVHDKFVLEPHWTVLNNFAYHANEKNAIILFISMLSSMFLHGDFMHLIGNLLFLWIFGRATEEFLGTRFFSLVYLTSGLAATLLQHVMATAFTPMALGIPNLGASGAIAGVLGLFVVRFFRTNVRIFYLSLPLLLGVPIIGPLLLIGGIIAAAILFFVFYSLLGNEVVAAVLTLCALIAGLYFFGRKWAWGAFRLRSVYAIGAWVVFMNLIPALYQMAQSHQGGGVAYWAHLGGFALGAVYALIIGGVEEGKDEYAVEDAQQALETKGAENALEQAGALLQKDPNNAEVHRIAASAYDGQGAREMAEKHYLKAIELAWSKGEREGALRIYQGALVSHPALPLSAVSLLNLANQFAQNGMWNEAGELWVRLIEEFPESPEAEIAYLRSAQMWSRQFNDNEEAARQLEMFLDSYPQSSWRPQAQQALSSIRRVA